MSYCVNCGVELDDSAKKCALCGAPVLNPYLDEPEEALPPPYPDRLALPEGTNRRYIAFLVSMVLLIPNLICGVANLLILDSGVWSAYIVSSSLLFWVFFIVPFLMEKPRPLVLWLLDTLAGTLYTWLYYVVGWGPRGWFLHLGLPLILGLSVISLFMIHGSGANGATGRMFLSLCWQRLRYTPFMPMCCLACISTRAGRCNIRW